MGVVKGAITIRDNATAVLRGIRNEQTVFRRDVAETRRELQRTWDKRFRANVETTAATRQMRRLREAMSPLRRKIATIVTIKDFATSKVKEIGGKIKAVGKMVAAPVIKLKDSLSAGISKASQKLKSAFKAVAIPVTVAATVTSLVLGGSIKAGMELEKQQVSMEHFIGATNKGMNQGQVKEAAADFSGQLRENANTTPFETGEVMAAGSRAVAITSGNTKEAMSLIKLAEDMSAASGGTQSLSQAVEALADAKMGETERLKGFGFKVSAEELKEKGFRGLSADLNDFFGGAAEKLAATGAGLVSTIKGKLKSNVADFGLKVVEQLKPALEGVISLIDQSAPFMEKFGTAIAGGIGKGIQAFIGILPKIASGFQAMQPLFKGFTGLIKGIGDAVQILAPVFSNIFADIGNKVGSVVGFMGEKMGFMKEVIATATPVIADILTTAWSVISPVMDICMSTFKLLFSVVQKVFPGVQSVITSVWEVVKPLVEGIGSTVGAIANGWSSIVEAVTGNGKKVGANADGTNNWKGGLTWVGEKGPELIDLPKGSRVLPNKESVAFAKQKNGVYQVPMAARQNGGTVLQTVKKVVSVTIAKLADTIVVREEADIDKIGTDVADKIMKVVLNMP